jgi:hypothetical protein
LYRAGPGPEPARAANIDTDQIPTHVEPARTRAANIDADQISSSPGQIIRPESGRPSQSRQASNQHSKLLADPSRENEFIYSQIQPLIKHTG